MSRLLLVSTYELGSQPLGIAVPAAALRAAGHDVRVADLALEDWPEADLAWAEGLVCSVPMHTALRLTVALVERARREHPGLRVALHGLYAPVAVEIGLLGRDDCATAADPIGALLAWAAGTKIAGDPTALAARAPALLPDRRGLPPLDRYATMQANGVERLVGAVDASIGCNHRCRHCPVPVVFDGRSRPVDADVVLADIDQLVKAGAGHIHFGDPDFLNRPHHALRVAEALHRRHCEVSFDATIKVSHLLRHQALLPSLRDAGLAFVISAFESTSEVVLQRLDKGHTAADLHTVVGLARAEGIELRPSLLPFTPWTTREDLVEIFDFVASHDLIWNLDPVQLSIRLLLPPGSLVLREEDPALLGRLGALDEASLGTSWTAADPLLDEIQQAVASRCEEAAVTDEPPPETFAAARALVFEALGQRVGPLPGLVVEPGPPGPSRPRLSEPWFCCAEPTTSQRALVEAVPISFRDARHEHP